MPIESQTLDTPRGMDPVNFFAHFSPKDRQLVDQSLGAHKRFVYGEAIHLGRRSDEADPVESVRFFVQFVMNQFYYLAHSRDGRAVVTSNVVGPQQSGLEGADEKPPAIMVLGIGGPFPPLSTDVDPFHLPMPERYRHCVVPIMVSRPNESSPAANWEHVARNLFSKQPARLFFYGLEFSARNCRIVLCHRAGSQLSPYIGMGDLYLSSIIYTCLPWEPIMLGFDGGSSPIGGKSVYLVLRPGAIYATQNDGSPIHHRICNKIRSQGSTVWRVKRVNAEGGLQATTSIVKQSWRTAKSILAELKLLAMLRGLSGFAQVKGHVPKMWIDVLPGISEKIASAMTEEMRLTFSNIVFEDHGRPLDRFASTQELLYATRDAVQGIIYLWGLGILHTNIDPSHILISRSDDNASGVRGVLIDFKDAQQVGHNGRLPRASYRMGLPSFNSLSVLHAKWDSLTFRPRTPYDDMESVFWILVGICQTFTAPGCQIDDPKHIHRGVRRYWLRFPEDEILPNDPELAGKKELLGLQLHNPGMMSKDQVDWFRDGLVRPFFGPIMAALLKELADLSQWFNLDGLAYDTTLKFPTPSTTMWEVSASPLWRWFPTAFISAFETAIRKLEFGEEPIRVQSLPTMLPVIQSQPTVFNAVNPHGPQDGGYATAWETRGVLPVQPTALAALPGTRQIQAITPLQNDNAEEPFTMWGNLASYGGGVPRLENSTNFMPYERSGMQVQPAKSFSSMQSEGKENRARKRPLDSSSPSRRRVRSRRDDMA